jgi:hypothetical protein
MPPSDAAGYVRLPRPAFLQEADKDDGVIGQIFSHTRQIGVHVDAERAQRRRGS